MQDLDLIKKHFLTPRMVGDSTSAEDLWSTSTGLSLLLTAVCRKSLSCMHACKWENLSVFSSLSVIHVLFSSFQSQKPPCHPGRIWPSVRRWANSGQDNCQGKHEHNRQNLYFFLSVLVKRYYIVCSTPSRPSLTPTTTPRTSTMTSPSWSCHHRRSWHPACLLCAWLPPPPASPLEPHVSPLDGAGPVKPVSDC